MCIWICPPTNALLPPVCMMFDDNYSDQAIPLYTMYKCIFVRSFKRFKSSVWTTGYAVESHIWWVSKTVLRLLVFESTTTLLITRKLWDQVNVSVNKCRSLESDHWAEVIVLLLSFACDPLFLLINSCVCVCASVCVCVWACGHKAAVVEYGPISAPKANRLQHIPVKNSCILSSWQAVAVEIISLISSTSTVIQVLQSL